MIRVPLHFIVRTVLYAVAWLLAQNEGVVLDVVTVSLDLP